MFQNVDGRVVYVVEFDTMPKLPIHGTGKGEQMFADALTQAIEKKQVTKPGKYGIQIDYFHDTYEIFEVIE